MAIKIIGIEFKDDVKRHAAVGWQCPECYGVNITRQESKYGGVSEDCFSCRECGAQWGRNIVDN